jgi:hypothetical protein
VGLVHPHTPKEEDVLQLRTLLRYCLSSFTLVALQLLASAQCPIPDQLDGGPCCTLAQEKLPFFPKVTQDTLGICWRDCNVDQVALCRAIWTNVPLQQATGSNCGIRTMDLRLLDTTGIVKWRGRMRLTYARTWLETPPTGIVVQVWRFLVNGDLSPSAAVGPIPCPVPPCAPANGNRVRFTGYLDYALDCSNNVFQNAWMLTHACDFIDHHSGFPRAGAFHPDRSYSFVGPAAGFVPAPLLPIEGTPGSPFEDVRRLRYPVPGTTGPIHCEFEERIQFSLLPQSQFCLCGLPGTQQWNLANLFLTGVCGTSIVTTGGPFLPGFLSMGIGSWTFPATYPGVEDLRWNTGGHDYVDPCTGVVQPEVFFGVTTIGGDPAFELTSGGPGAPLPPFFIDQANSERFAGGVLSGTVMNVPYASDHILSLNH